MRKSAPGISRACARTHLLKLLQSATLLIGLASSARAQTSPAADAANSAIAGNPGAVNVTPGTGELGRLLGFEPESGLRLGGVLVSNGNYLIAGGNTPGATSFNNLLLTDFEADLDRLAHIPGAGFGTAMLRFDGQASNQDAGVVTGYNGLTGAPPLHRTELYELWWRQSFFSDGLVIRVGKTVPTFDFNNVVRPVPVQDLSLQIPGVSGLLYTPIFVNPTILGALPGYYNSAYGLTTTVAPTERFYVSWGGYDGNGARGVQTGLQAGPTFNGYRFQIGETGTAWLLGPDNLPGSAAIGGWDQTGTLSTPQHAITQNGTHGVYAFASQRLWAGSRGDGQARGVSGFIQLGTNNSRTLFATRYVGLGLTAFGIIPSRPADSLGAGLAWSSLNRNLGFRPTGVAEYTCSPHGLVGSEGPEIGARLPVPQALPQRRVLPLCGHCPRRDRRAQEAESGHSLRRAERPRTVSSRIQFIHESGWIGANVLLDRGIPWPRERPSRFSQ